MNTYICKEEKSETRDFILYLKILFLRKQMLPKVSRRITLRNIKVELNKIENKNRQKSMKSKAGSLKKKQTIKSIRKKRRGIQIENIRNERGDITTDPTNIDNTAIL